MNKTCIFILAFSISALFNAQGKLAAQEKFVDCDVYSISHPDLDKESVPYVKQVGEFAVTGDGIFVYRYGEFDKNGNLTPGSLTCVVGFDGSKYWIVYLKQSKLRPKRTAIVYHSKASLNSPSHEGLLHSKDLVTENLSVNNLNGYCQHRWYSAAPFHLLARRLGCEIVDGFPDSIISQVPNENWNNGKSVFWEMGQPNSGKWTFKVYVEKTRTKIVELQVSSSAGYFGSWYDHFFPCSYNMHRTEEKQARTLGMFSLSSYVDSETDIHNATTRLKGGIPTFGSKQQNSDSSTKRE